MDDNQEKKYDQVRLPKTFNPDKYNLDVFVDILNLKYNIQLEIELSVKELNGDLVILNSVNNFFEIKRINCKDFDPIGDYYIDNIENSIYNKNLNFCFTEDLIEFKNYSFELYSKFKQSYDYNFFHNMSKQNLLETFIKFVIENKLVRNQEMINFQKIINMNCNKLDILSLIENFSLKDIKEEAVYIKLSRNYSEGERLKMVLEIEGRVRCNEKRFMGFYMSIWGPQSNDMQLGRNEFLKLWKNKMNHEDNYLKNTIFTVACEPIEFRSVFPCFDEPYFKSKFNLKINVEKYILEFNPQIISNFKVVSNGELLEVSQVNKLNKELVEYKFSESPMMSIYLLNWTIGYYDYVETISNNVTIRAYTLLDRQGDASFALDLAQKALDFYRNYFKIPYMFHKLDLVPVPNLEFRALECWGCIIFLNYALLVNKFLDIKEKKFVARTIVHELCHQWFGNLVTMDWWDDIWLNEGFARFLEFECLSEIKPELDINYQFIELFYQDALIIDESLYTHPVRGHCPSPRNLCQIFDTISYAKGASCIRMIYFFIGKDVFRDVISNYLIQYKYKTTTTKNLWNVFKLTKNIDIEKIMYNWVNLSGHPALYVSITEDEKHLVIEQHPFPKNFNSQIDENLIIWKIPLFIKTHEKDIIILMEEKRLVLNLEKDLNIIYERLIKKEQYVKINFEIKGFYRVFYDTRENIEISKEFFSDKDKYIQNDLSQNKKFFFENILLNSLLTNHKKLSSLDIVGLLTDYLIINDFTTCLHIIDNIKPINDYLVLFYVNKIYNYLKANLFKYSPFKEFLLDDNKEFFKCEFDNYKIPEECFEIPKFLDSNYIHIFELIEKINKNFLENLLDYDVVEQEYFEKIYVKDPLCYLNESKDEFLELALSYYNCHSKKPDLINYITKNFEKGKSIIHKNLKYEAYHIAINYAFDVFKDIKQEINLFQYILSEFTTEFYDLSMHGKQAFKNSFLDFENCSDELVSYFILNMKNDKMMSEVFFKNIDYFKRYPTNRKKFIDCYIQIIINDYIDKKNIFSGDIQFLSFLKNHPILKKDIPLIFEDIEDANLARIIFNYFYNSFKKLILPNEKKSLFNILAQNMKIQYADIENINRFTNLLLHLNNFFIQER